MAKKALTKITKLWFFLKCLVQLRCLGRPEYSPVYPNAVKVPPQRGDEHQTYV